MLPGNPIVFVFSPREKRCSATPGSFKGPGLEKSGRTLGKIWTLWAKAFAIPPPSFSMLLFFSLSLFLAFPLCLFVSFALCPVPAYPNREEMQKRLGESICETRQDMNEGNVLTRFPSPTYGIEKRQEGIGIFRI